LAQVLAGSQAKGMARFGYDRHKFYGKLAGLTQNQITVLIDTLISARYIRHAGTDLPVLSLTETGRQAVATRAALPIPVPDQLTYPGRTIREQSGPDQAVTARPDPEAAAPETVVLEAVARLDGTLGRTGLAQLLSGSRAAWLEPYASHPAYGRLSQLSQQAIVGLIDTLIAMGKLSKTGGPRPKVVGSKMPSKTEQADPAPIVAEATAQTEPTFAPEAKPTADSEAAPSSDPVLLEALRTWRTDQARIRRVRPYIVASNRLLAAIASRRPATLEELGTITGIGPARLANYGEAIIAIVMTGDYLKPDGDDASADNASAAGITVKEDLYGYRVIAGS
jgi:superfamily II DNA helicase RecQ